MTVFPVVPGFTLDASAMLLWLRGREAIERVDLAHHVDGRFIGVITRLEP